MLERLKGPIFELIDIFTTNAMYRQAEIVECIISFFVVAVIIFMVFPLRECARGFVAKKLGDSTGEREGRLTLNPFAHIDPMGALCLCITCIGWPKHMPINYRNCNKVSSRNAVLLTSLAGPVASIVMSYIVLIAAKLIAFSGDPGDVMLYIFMGLIYVASINVSLAVLHLLPIPPFDGCNIMCCFLPARAAMTIQRNAQMINTIFFFVLIIGVLDGPLSWLSNGLIWLLDKASFFVGTIY